MLEVDLYSDPDLLNVAAFYPATTTLGPGRRAILWLQGCLQSCPHCVTPEMQPIIEVEWIEVEELAGLVASIDGIEGITVVGGEPLLQYRALARFLDFLKKRGLATMLYTGYLYEDLIGYPRPEIGHLLSNTDILVDGPYLREEDHGEMWRGSANQRILFLSERYKGWEWVRRVKKRDLSLHYSDDGRYLLLGIPPASLILEKGPTIR